MRVDDVVQSTTVEGDVNLSCDRDRKEIWYEVCDLTGDYTSPISNTTTITTIWDDLRLLTDIDQQVDLVATPAAVFNSTLPNLEA